MSDGGTVDTIIPWTIKAISKAARDVATDAARRDGLTVGQWLEKAIIGYLDAGSPVVVVSSSPPAPVDLVGLAAAMQAMKDVSAAAGVQVPPQLAKDSQAAVRVALRQAKGLPPRAASKAKPVQALQASIGGA